MNEHVVHFCESDPDAENRPAWEEALEKEGFVLLRAKTLNQAKYYAQAYKLVGLLMAINGDAQSKIKTVEELAGAAGPCRFPIFGLASKSPPPKAQEQLAQAGLTALVDPKSPPEFLMHQLRAQRSLLDLKVLEESGMDLKSLAREARKILHDLSQPLTALQGQLQILEIKSDDGDPMKSTLRDMTGLAMQITDYLRQLHELHRKYS